MDYPRLGPGRWLSDPYDLITCPFYDTPSNYYRPWRWYNQSVSKEFASTIENEKGNFKITLDVQHFKPEDISVKVTNTEIIVEGKHEERPDTHGFITRQFKRRYALPSHCSSENVTSTMSSDGVLTIIADKRISKDLEKIIPIKMCGVCPAKTKIACTTKNLNTSSNCTSSGMAQKSEKIKDTEMKESTIRSNVEITQKAEKNKDNEEICKNKNTQIMLKEDHSRLLRPELLKDIQTQVQDESAETTTNTEMSDFMKTTEKIDAISSKLEETSNKIKESLAKSSVGMSMLAEEMGRSEVASTSDMSAAKGMSQMMMEQSSSMKASSIIVSSTKMSSTASERVSDIISAELREAAENV